jgi:AcrR family transcriptional regulator
LEDWRNLSPRQGGAGALGKQQRTRRRLLGFAMQLFAEQGYQPTTVAEIAAAAGVSRATFFLHFPTKAALLGELSRAIAELWEERAMPPGERATDTIRRFLVFLFEETDADAVGSAILLDFVQTYGADMNAGIGHGTLHHHMERMIAQAQAEGNWTSEWSASALGHLVLTAFNLLRGELVDRSPEDAAKKLLALIDQGTETAISRTF